MNRGELFERQFIASIPPAPTWHRKLTTPVPPPSGAIIGTLGRLADQTGEDVGWAKASLSRSSHTPVQPFDLLISAPGKAIGHPCPVLVDLLDASGVGFCYSVSTRIDFALELKSTGTQKSMAFDRLKPHQVKGLQKARAAGLVAGLVVEFPDVSEGGEAYFIPIEVLIRHIETCERKSLSIDAARRFGVLIERDPVRGSKHRYWRVGAFLALFGADVL